MVHAASSKSFELHSLGFFNSFFDTPIQEEMQPQRKECIQVQYSEKVRGRSRSISHQNENFICVLPSLDLMTIVSRSYESVWEQNDVNLIDLDDTSGSKITLPDSEESFGDIDILKRELQEQIYLRSKREKEKEKESEVIRVVIERGGLIRQIATLKALAQENDKPIVEGHFLMDIIDKRSEKCHEGQG